MAPGPERRWIPNGANRAEVAGARRRDDSIVLIRAWSDVLIVCVNATADGVPDQVSAVASDLLTTYPAPAQESDPHTPRRPATIV